MIWFWSSESNWISCSKSNRCNVETNSDSARKLPILAQGINEKGFVIFELNVFPLKGVFVKVVIVLFVKTYRFLGKNGIVKHSFQVDLNLTHEIVWLKKVSVPNLQCQHIGWSRSFDCVQQPIVERSFPVLASIMAISFLLILVIDMGFDKDISHVPIP